MDANTTASDSEQTTTTVDVRTTDLSEFEDGEAIRVHYRDEVTEPSKTVTGRIVGRYTDRKVMIETEEGRRLIVNLSDVGAEGGLRDFDTSDVLGRPMFAESAYHVEKTGEDVRRELLGDDDESDADGDEECMCFRCGAWGTDYTKVRTTRETDAVACPECVEDGTGIEGSRGDDEDSETPDTLVYENRLSGADETGAEYERISTIEVRGVEVGESRNPLTGEFVTEFDGRECDHLAGGTGTFYLRENGKVLFAPEGRDPYEAGENGRIE